MEAIFNLSLSVSCFQLILHWLTIIGLFVIVERKAYPIKEIVIESAENVR